MTRRTATALAVTAAALCLASGCGVPPSGVVEVGEPATGMALSNAVYFLDRAGPGTTDAQPADGVVLRAVARDRIPGLDPVTSAVRQLLAGPTRAESEGLATALPPNIGRPEVTLGRDREAGTVVIRFPAGTPRLGVAALRQLSCTVGLAVRAGAAQSTGGTGGAGGGEGRTAPTSTPSPGVIPDLSPRPAARIIVEGAGGQPVPAIEACLSP
ncbi:GerMN domain-containing protein [Streptomyces sp. NPDC057137]|uniref:GerMN domain-containing protein n=1 Tax=Streptomyces sp. NPDC057137 TaxID=3346030 RepID=UPI00362F1F7C